MSPLDRLLLALNVHVEAFAICVVSRGWRLVLDPMDAPILHYVLTGTGRLQPTDGPAVAFGRHSLVVVPPRYAHSLEVPDGGLQEARGLDQRSPLADGLLRMHAGGGGEDEVMTACGTIQATFAGTVGLFDHLRQPIVEDLARPRRCAALSRQCSPSWPCPASALGRWSRRCSSSAWCCSCAGSWKKPSRRCPG